MSEVEDYYTNLQLQAQRANYTSQDDNPDDAAEAIDLSDATGFPAPAINDNLDEFKRQHKLALGKQIINDNEYIASYLSSHPLAASVSHDDLGALDETSQAIQALPHKSKLGQWLESDSIAQSFMSGFGQQPIGQERFRTVTSDTGVTTKVEQATSLEKATGLYSRPSDIEFALSYPMFAATVGRAIGLGELGVEANVRTINGLIQAGRDGIAATFGEGTASAFEGLAQAAIDPATQETLIGAGPPGAVAAGALRGLELFGKLLSAYKIAGPWAKIGKEPPPGLHPLIDDAKKVQARDDISALDEALSTAAKSATRERAPDLFANFIRDHIGDRQIGLDPEAVRGLYGDTDPFSDDGKLGFVQDLKKQLEAAEVTGDDVRIPLADWLAKVDPDIAKQLHDDIRVRDNGMTINETKIEAEPKTTIADPVSMLRGAGGLEPLAAVGDRFVQLKKRVSEPAVEGRGVAFDQPALHDVDILDENGNTIGTINISEQKGGKQLYIDMIQVGSKENKFYQPNFLGPAMIRDMKRQLKNIFPNAETITGHRVSGAREKAGEAAWMAKSAMPVVKLQIADAMDNPQIFRDLLQPYWDFLNPQSDIELLRGPFNEQAKKINEDVVAELKRIAPQANMEVVHSIFFPKAGGSAAGLWSPRLQKIFVSLEGKDAVGTVRHEAIHSLRAMDLIREDEWLDLKQAAKEGGWRDRFNIDKNYKNFTEDQKDEEAIAEAYRYWRRGEDIIRDPTAFQRIKDFIDMVHRRIKEALGRDFTWEEIFKDIDTGRIGRREQPFESVFPEEGREAAHIEEPTGEEPSFGIYDRGKALGITQAHNDRMLEHIRKRNEEDLEAANRRAEVRQRRRSNKEYKERRTVLRDEVSNDLQQRPNIALDNLFSKQKIKFDPAYLTEDQRARLPKEYLQKKDGINPDDLAPYFGYTSGDALVERLGMLTEDRRRSGMNQRDHFNRLVDVETDRRLNQEFGDREQHILDEAKDQALSETQLNLVHEETMAYAYKANATPAPKAGDIRFYHGTSYKDASGFTGKTFVTPSYDYAKNYHGGPNNVLYADLSKEEAIKRGLYDEINNFPIHGPIDDGAAILKPHSTGQDFVPQFSKDQVRDMVRSVFNDMPVGSISSDRMIQTAGKIGKKIEEAGSKGDWAEAYRLSQQRNHAMIAAKFAREYEKQRAQLDRNMKTNRKRESASIPAEYMNWIHDVMLRVGYPVNRSIQDLAENIGHQSEGTLKEFVQAKNNAWQGQRELSIADFLQDPNFRQPVDKLSYSDFRDLKSSIDQLAKAGRDERKVYAEGEVADRKSLLREFYDKLKTFGYKASNVKPGMIGQWPRLIVYSMTAKETTFNRWDRADPLGVFNRFLSYPLADAANGKQGLQREVSREYAKLQTPKDLNKLVDSPITDPMTRTPDNPDGSGTWVGFNRGNVIKMLFNAGNESNWKVLAHGYGADPVSLFNWLQRNVTKEDIEFVEGVGNIFKKLIAKYDNVRERQTGMTVEKLQLKPIEFKLTDGTVVKSDGWYHPLVADPQRKTVWVQDPDTGLWSQKAQGKRESLANDAYNFTVADGFTKKRTGAIYPLDLEFNAVPTTINQMIHAISYKEVLHETQKIFGDPTFRENVAKYYGSEYADGLMPYLQRLAGGSSTRNLSKAIGVSEYFRQNVISTYIGVNIYTMLKHGPTALVMSAREVGLKPFSKAMSKTFVNDIPFLESTRTLFGLNPTASKGIHDFIMDNFEEVARRERNWQDTVSNQGDRIAGAKNWREKTIEIASSGVAWSDMVSAGPTALAAYSKAIDAGRDQGQAITLANRAVRRAHGSTAETNLPPAVAGAGDVLHPWLTSVYGFFGTAMQRRIEMAHKLNDTYHLVGEREFAAATKKAWSAFGDFMTFMVWPTIVEELVQGIGTDDHRTLGTRIISGATMGAASSVLYLRDLVHGLVSGHEPGVGMASSAMHDFENVFRDLAHGKDALNRQHAGKTIGDLLTLTGEGTGRVPKFVGNATRYGINVAAGQERPKTPADILLGVTKGTQKRRQEK